MMKTSTNKPSTHWTNKSIEDYQSRVTFDFISQLEDYMDAVPMQRKDLAEKLGVTPSAVSQILNNPDNLKLETIIGYSRALGLKVAIVPYSDGDPDNTNGPINSEIFTMCWERRGKPTNFLELSEQSKSESTSKAYWSDSTNSQIHYEQTGNVAKPNIWEPDGLQMQNLMAEDKQAA